LVDLRLNELRMIVAVGEMRYDITAVCGLKLTKFWETAEDHLCFKKRSIRFYGAVPSEDIRPYILVQ